MTGLLKVYLYICVVERYIDEFVDLLGDAFKIQLRMGKCACTIEVFES